MSIGLTGALVGGVLTLLSPCSVMLLPSFFAYAFTDPRRLLSRTVVFYLGLIATLVPIGVLAGSLGAFVTAHRQLLVTVAAGVVIALGVVQLLGLPVPGLSRSSTGDTSSPVSVFLLGTVYGLAGVCAGPVLGSVLALAALGGDPLYGGIVLATFALGMTAPLFLLALLWPRAPWVRALVRPRELRVGRWSTTWTQVVGGLLGIGVGVLLLVTDGTATLTGVLGASQQAAVESWALRRSAAVPDVVVVAVAAVALAATWSAHRLRARRRAAAPADERASR